MEKVSIDQEKITYNGPLETGIRTVVILHSAYPGMLDLQKLTALDYLVVRTSLLGGPADLHPAAPIMSPVTQVRRKNVQDALYLMMSRHLVEQEVTKDGILYVAGENSALFVSSLQSVYLHQMIDRAKWLAHFFLEFDDTRFNKLMSSLFDNWMTEFQDESSNLGGLQ